MQATNNNAQATAAARAEDIQKAVATAIASAAASVVSTGVCNTADRALCGD